MHDRDSLLGVLQTIFRWKKAFRNVCLLALLGSAAASILLDDYYQATTVFYPASPQLASPELMFGASGQVTDYYGSDRELDRLAEIANSEELTSYMVSRFQLYQHYGQDSTKGKGQEEVRKIFRGLYSAEKNKNDAIEISMEDTDPQRAADMANAAREKVNEIAKRLTKDAQGKILAAFDRNIASKRAELTSLADSLRRLQNRYGIYDTEVKAEWLTQQFSQAESDITRYRAALEVLDKNPNIRRDTIEFIKANLRAAERQYQKMVAPSDNDLSTRHFAEGVPKVYVLKDLHFQARKQLSYDMERYWQIKSAYETDIPAIHLVSSADRPPVKNRPHRSIIVIGSVLGAFLLVLLAALIADAYRDVDWKSIRNGGIDG